MLTFGNTAVPYTVSWSAEDHFTVESCRFAGGRMAICQSVAPGQGKPIFGKPHSQRQRQAIAENLCDICGKTLKNRTRISLSHARARGNAAPGGTGILQVEPLLHRGCAQISVRFCPSLRRDMAAGMLMIRQVTRCRTQFAVMGPEYVHHYVPDYVAKPTDRIVGHAKVELLAWTDRDETWLMRAEAA
jgi:hypothetical protein